MACNCEQALAAEMERDDCRDRLEEIRHAMGSLYDPMLDEITNVQVLVVTYRNATMRNRELIRKINDGTQ